MPLARLSRIELRNTLRDLVGLDPAKLDDRDLPEDGAAPGGWFVGGGTVSTTDARLLSTLAGAVGEQVRGRISSFAPCSTPQSDERCAKTFVSKLGRRAFRRPPTADETARLLALYATARKELGVGYEDAIRILLQAMIQSPAFLYHWELGSQQATAVGGRIRLGSFERASRLSYFLQRTMPDDDLSLAADADELSTSAHMERHARRLLSSPKAGAMVDDFFSQWLGLAELERAVKDKAIHPSFGPELAASMRTESLMFARDVLLGEGGGHLGPLFTGTYSFINEDLGKIYGVKAPQTTSLQRAAVNAKPRAGVLTQSAFLSAHADGSGSHPVKRGHAIALYALCTELPVPPVVPKVDAPSPQKTTRDRFMKHGQAECAKACHEILDPLGMAFENYDGIGQWRDSENGMPVDASGRLTVGGEELSFRGAVELLGKLSTNPAAAGCMADQWLRFGLARDKTPQDAASVARIRSLFLRSGLDIRELVVAIATSDSFLYRSPNAGEVLP